VVGERGLAVVLAQVARDGLAVVGPEQLRRRVPQLARVGLLLAVQRVLELGVAPAQQGVELELVADGPEVEGLAGGEDDDLLGEVAIVRVVEAICLHARALVSKLSCQPLMEPPW
jgi:hypothetical protein